MADTGLTKQDIQALRAAQELIESAVTKLSDINDEPVINIQTDLEDIVVDINCIIDDDAGIKYAASQEQADHNHD